MSVVFIASNQSPKVLQPADGTFDPPAAAVAAKSAPILRARLHAIGTMRADQVNSTLSQTVAKRVAIGSAIVEQMPWQTAHSSLCEQRLNQGHFVGTGAGDVSAQRQAVGISLDHDLGHFAGFGLAYAAAPFIAEQNVPSAIASSACTWPSCCSLQSKRDQARAHAPHCVQSRSRRQQVLGDGKWLGKSFQRAPRRSTQQIPSKHSRDPAGGRPPLGEQRGGGNTSAIHFHCSSSSSYSGSIMAPDKAACAAPWRDRGISDLLSTATDTRRINRVFS